MVGESKDGREVRVNRGGRIAAVVLALLWRPSVRGHGRDAWRLAVAFGVSLAVMNFFFYEALDRIPLGLAVTFEFVGPLGVALVDRFDREEGVVRHPQDVQLAFLRTIPALREARMLLQYRVEMAIGDADLSNAVARTQAIKAASEIIAEMPQGSERVTLDPGQSRRVRHRSSRT